MTIRTHFHEHAGRSIRARWHAPPAQHQLAANKPGTSGENWAWLLNRDKQVKAEAASVGMQFGF